MMNLLIIVLVILWMIKIVLADPVSARPPTLLTSRPTSPPTPLTRPTSSPTRPTSPPTLGKLIVHPYEKNNGTNLEILEVAFGVLMLLCMVVPVRDSQGYRHRR